MDKHFLNGIKQGIGFLFVIAVFTTVVFGVGFHNASEVLSGIFQGNYTFNGTVNVGSQTNSQELTIYGNINVSEDSALLFSDGTNITTGETGKILQVQTLVSDTIYSTASGTFEDSGIELNITPISNDSIILIMFDFGWTTNPTTTGAKVKIVRDSLDIRTADLYSGVSAQIHHFQSFKAIESNLNKSQEYTYKIQHRLSAGTVSGLEKTSFIIMEISN